MALKCCNTRQLMQAVWKLQAQNVDKTLCVLSQTVFRGRHQPISCAGVCLRALASDASSPWQKTRGFVTITERDNPLQSNRTVLNRICSWHPQTSSVRHMSGAVMSKFTQDIDLEKLREEVKREARETGQQIQLVEKVKALVAQRCAEAIANYSEEEKKRLRVIQLEHNFLYSEGQDIVSPECMKDEDWVEAMELPSKAQRLRYYLHLQKRLYKKQAEQHKKAAHKEEMQNRPSHEEYEHGRIFMRVYETTMKKWLSYRLAAAMQHGIPLVFDMDYVELMRPREQKNTAHQLHAAYCLNRGDPALDPFHIHFTGCPPTNSILKLMEIRTQDSPFMLTSVTDQSYMDVFDKDRLVYLSPHGRQVMREFDPDAVYIIGAFNDKATQKPVSYARAMEQGIRCQRLPIDEHLSWNQGSKNLTLDQMMKIMLAVKNQLPWKEAFGAIPQRKLR